MNLPAPFSKRQEEYFYRCFDNWFNVAEGGKRGGKNVLATMVFCTLLENHKNRIHLVAGVSIATAKLNILDCDGYGLLNFFEGRCREGKYKNRDCVYVSTKAGEKVILVSGGGKDGDEKLIKGNTYGMAYITESNECHPKFLKEVFDRTLSSSDRKVFHDLNPKGEKHWYYDDILGFHEIKQAENQNYGYNYGHFTIVDNYSMTDEKLVEVLETYNKETVWYKRDIRGERAVAEGIIYDMFDSVKHVVNSLPNLYQSGRYVSIDYGTQNATVFLLWNKGLNNKWYCTKEYYYSGRDKGKQKTDAEYTKDLKKFLQGTRVKAVIVDPSAASFIAELRKNGFPVLKAKNNVEDGIRLVGTLLNQERILFSSCCTNTIMEFASYIWDSKAAEKGEDKPIKQHDHAMDAVRYFCFTILNNQTARIKSKQAAGLR